MMRYAWDENKRQHNLRKHRLDFEEASRIFNGLLLTFEDTRFDYDEQRLVSLGLLRGKVVVIVYTETVDTRRIISLRKGTKHEEQIFFNAFKNGL